MGMEDLQEKQVTVDESSLLKVKATVRVKISYEVDIVKTMMKLPSLYSKRNSTTDKSMGTGVGFQLVSTQLDPNTMKPKVSKERVEDWLKGRNGKANNDSGRRLDGIRITDGNYGGVLLGFFKLDTSSTWRRESACLCST
ncbi:Lipase/lipooxygenase, PLAT/LH2 [Artemisia annua]|uniref:Lipase/lipooxygenase, PLAT/LH2 n=1 Tax=Artemisia annua TaxID=35608 RepID=A0A2U1MZA7_ARTAN|nr:Lipase/lipooxygenase, PLAT/LH2 [Artemisia annua]